MKRLSIMTMVLVLGVPCIAVAESDTGELLANIAKATSNAIVSIQGEYKDEVSSSQVSGIGICYNAEAGEFLAFIRIFERPIRPEGIKNLRLVIPGPDQKSIDAEFMGMDPATRISFIRAKEKYPWQAVRFAERSNLQVGQKVVSVGLIPGNAENTPYYGIGYISSFLRIPQRIYYVTGGRLTSYGSPVFGQDGLAVGIVAQSIFMDYQMATAQGQTSVALRSRQESPFFMPVDEFVHILKRIPRDGRVRRLPWIGVLNIIGVGTEQADLMDLDRPAAQIAKVIPGTAADKAGLKTGDVIIAMNGKPLENYPAPALVARKLLQQIQRMNSGEKVTFTIRRSGKDSDVSLELAAAPLLPNQAKRYINRKIGLVIREKVMLDEYLDPSPEAKLQGLSVLGVGKTGPVQAAGVKVNDLVVAINGQPVNTAETFKKILEDALANEPEKSIILLIRRSGQEPQAISIRPPSE